MSKKAAKNAVFRSRELTVEELTQVGGAWGVSDSGGYDSGGYYYDDSYSDYSYDDYYSADDSDVYDPYFESAGDGDVYDPGLEIIDESFANDPDIEIGWDGGMQVVEQTGDLMTQEEKAEYDANYNEAFNDCMDGTTALDAVSMAVGGTAAEEFMDHPAYSGLAEVFPVLGDIREEVKEFNERAADVGAEFAYCEAIAEEAAAEAADEEDEEDESEEVAP